jgi:hypothetical protein
MLVFLTAYSSCARKLPLRDSGFLFKPSQENTPSDFLQESGRNRKYTGNDIRIDDQEYLILREEEEANDNSF